MVDLAVLLNKCERLIGAIAGLTLLAFLSGPAAAMPANDRHDLTPAVFGQWEPPDMDAVIAIRECGEALCAELVRHDYGSVSTDINNPDPDMRARPLKGVRILDGLRHAKAGWWKGGTLYDPRTGRTYFSKMKLLDNDRLKITGCIGPRLCKGYVWMRVGQ